jgi:ATP synthase protein I
MMQNIKDDESNQSNQEGQEQQDDHPVAWTQEQANAWRAKNPSESPWRLVGVQSVVVLLMAMLAWMYTGQGAVAWSVAYGGLCVVVPLAMFIHGTRPPKGGVDIRQRMVKFVVWELAKIVLTMVMLFLAPKVVSELNWLALLAGFVVTIKLYWLAFLKMPLSKRLRKTH